MKEQYGYVRVSTKDQNEDRQLLALREFGISQSRIYMDKQSGKDFKRPAYQILVHHLLKKGDLLVVQSIDRLGRNYREILEEWRYITKKVCADIKVLDMPLLDTRPEKDLVGTLITDIVLQLLSFVAENEREAIRKRQAEGIAAARARGVHLGHPVEPIPERFPSIYKSWKSKEITGRQAMSQMGISKDAFYRLVHKYEGSVLGIRKQAKGRNRPFAKAKQKQPV